MPFANPYVAAGGVVSDKRAVHDLVVELLKHQLSLETAVVLGTPHMQFWNQWGDWAEFVLTFFHPIPRAFFLNFQQMCCFGTLSSPSRSSKAVSFYCKIW